MNRGNRRCISVLASNEGCAVGSGRSLGTDTTGADTFENGKVLLGATTWNWPCVMLGEAVENEIIGYF